MIYSNCLCGFKRVLHYSETEDRPFSNRLRHYTKNECEICAPFEEFYNSEESGRSGIINVYEATHPILQINKIENYENRERNNIINKYEDDIIKYNYYIIFTSSFITVKDAYNGIYKKPPKAHNISRFVHDNGDIYYISRKRKINGL